MTVNSTEYYFGDSSMIEILDDGVEVEGKPLFTQDDSVSLVADQRSHNRTFNVEEINEFVRKHTLIIPVAGNLFTYGADLNPISDYLAACRVLTVDSYKFTTHHELDAAKEQVIAAAQASGIELDVVRLELALKQRYQDFVTGYHWQAERALRGMNTAEVTKYVDLALELSQRLDFMTMETATLKVECYQAMSREQISVALQKIKTGGQILGQSQEEFVHMLLTDGAVEGETEVLMKSWYGHSTDPFEGRNSHPSDCKISHSKDYYLRRSEFDKISEKLWPQVLANLPDQQAYQNEKVLKLIDEIQAHLTEAAELSNEVSLEENEELLAQARRGLLLLRQKIDTQQK